jgi:hypothetical protein
MSEARIDRLEAGLARVEQAVIRIETRLAATLPRALRPMPNSPTDRAGVLIGVSARQWRRPIPPHSLRVPRAP